MKPNEYTKVSKYVGVRGCSPRPPPISLLIGALVTLNADNGRLDNCSDKSPLGFYVTRKNHSVRFNNNNGDRRRKTKLVIISRPINPLPPHLENRAILAPRRPSHDRERPRCKGGPRPRARPRRENGGRSAAPRLVRRGRRTDGSAVRPKTGDVRARL